MTGRKLNPRVGRLTDISQIISEKAIRVVAKGQFIIGQRFRLRIGLLLIIAGVLIIALGAGPVVMAQEKPVLRLTDAEKV